MIKIILSALNLVLQPLIALIDIPVIPPEVQTIINQILGYIDSGLGIVDFFCPLNLIMPGLNFIIALEAAYVGYRLVVWVLGKIPFLSISDN